MARSASAGSKFFIGTTVGLDTAETDWTPTITAMPRVIPSRADMSCDFLSHSSFQIMVCSFIVQPFYFLVGPQEALGLETVGAQQPPTFLVADVTRLATSTAPVYVPETCP